MPSIASEGAFVGADHGVRGHAGMSGLTGPDTGRDAPLDNLCRLPCVCVNLQQHGIDESS